MRSRPRAVQRRHRPHCRQRVPQDRRREGVQSYEDRSRPRSLRPQQGHQERRAGQDRARFRARAGYHPLLRGGLHGRRACAAPRAGRRRRGRPHHRRGQPHLHVRRAGRVRHGRGLHRRRCGLRHRQGVVQGARVSAVQDRGRAGSRRHRQGRHPAHHRHDRRGRRALPGHGVHRQRHSEHGHGRAHEHLEHGHRGGRQGRAHRGRRRDARLPGRPHRAPLHRVPFRRGRDVCEGVRDRRRLHRAHRVVPAPAVEHAPGRRGARRQNRSGRHRQLHERPHRRHAPGRRRAARPHGASRRALHRDPRHAGGVSPVHGGRPHGRVPRRELRRVHAYVRPLPGRLHGHSRRRRARHRHDEPQLRRPHGRPTSEVYLSSPAIAAASAVLGHIGLPEDLD